MSFARSLKLLLQTCPIVLINSIQYEMRARHGNSCIREIERNWILYNAIWLRGISHNITSLTPVHVIDMFFISLQMCGFVLTYLVIALQFRGTWRNRQREREKNTSAVSPAICMALAATFTLFSSNGNVITWLTLSCRYYGRKTHCTQPKLICVNCLCQICLAKIIRCTNFCFHCHCYSSQEWG